jgi:histidinol-phosphate aminotransferase
VGLLDHYRQFEGMPEEEVNAGLRERAAERRRKALATVEPLDLSRTTWPEYPHPAVVNAITFAARRGLHRYLDRHASELRAELAHRFDVTRERLVVGDGAAQLLTAATQALVEAPTDEVITPWPSYPLYPLMARRARAHAVPVAGFGADAILSAVTDRTRLVVLCNPNDPTGELVPADELRRLLEGLPERAVLLLDEALRDFVDAEPVDAALALTEEHPRLLVFRTFSKAWGLAGLRVGHAIGGPGAEPLLERLEPDLGVNELAQAGALEALRSSAAIVERRAADVAARRGGLIPQLRALGLDIANSQANVAWVAAPGLDGSELAHRLERASVLVQAGGALGAPARVRIAIPTTDVGAERLRQALERALG